MADSEANSSVLNDFKPLIVKSIALQRLQAYSGHLMKAEALKEELEANLSKIGALFDELKKDETSNDSFKLFSSSRSSQQSSEIDDRKKARVRAIDQAKGEILDSYLELKDFANLVCQTKCKNFAGYLVQLILFFHYKLNELLKADVEKSLVELNYPVDARNKLEPAPKASDQKSSSEEAPFKTIVDRLLQAELPGHAMKSLEASERATDQLSVLMELVTRPLSKKFKFHFFGNRKTNNPEKPEWYLSHILKWINDNEPFVSLTLQPLIQEHEKFKDKNALIEFTKKLIALIKEKLETDANILIKDQAKFSHTIAELIEFDKQLKEVITTNVLDSNFFKNWIHLSSLNFLCENRVLFASWIQLERQLCLNKVDLMFTSLNYTSMASSGSASSSSSSFLPSSLLSSGSSLTSWMTGQTLASSATTGEDKEINLLGFDDASVNKRLMEEMWLCNYADDLDTLKPPQCVESFMLMLKTVNDRCSNLYHPSKKLYFIALQIELLNDFHMRLCQITRDKAKCVTPFSKCYLSSLNAINYIIHLLDEWKNSQFYLEMQLIKLRYVNFKQKNEKNLPIDQTLERPIADIKQEEFDLNYQNRFDLDFDTCSVFDHQQLFDSNVREEMSTTSTLYNAIHLSLDDSIFDSTIASYEKIRDDMVEAICTNFMWEIRTRSGNYKKEKWHSMQVSANSEASKAMPVLTSSATDMLISLKNMLHLLRDSLSKSIFEAILRRILSELDFFFIHELIKPNQFNMGGVVQLENDINKYVLPILNEFATPNIIPEMFFQKTKESIFHLKLNN